MDRRLDLNLSADLFRIKKVKSIRKATEKIHMDRMMVLYYMTTDCNFLYTALSANSPARHIQT
jgi:hypothetical protein